MTNKELRIKAQEYIEGNNIQSNIDEIEKAFIDGAKMIRDFGVDNRKAKLDELMSLGTNKILNRLLIIRGYLMPCDYTLSDSRLSRMVIALESNIKTNNDELLPSMPA